MQTNLISLNSKKELSTQQAFPSYLNSGIPFFADNSWSYPVVKIREEKTFRYFTHKMIKSSHVFL